MDSKFLVLVFMAVISTAYTKHDKTPVNPLQNLENEAISGEIDKVPFYPNVPEEQEPYFNPSLYGPSAYGYGNMNMMMHPSRRGGFGHNPYRRGRYPHPMYLPPPHYPGAMPPPPPPPPPMAYWMSQMNANKNPPMPNEQIHPTIATTPSTTTTTTTITTTATSSEAMPEATTLHVEAETTEAPKEHQTDEPGEDPNKRQLLTHQGGGKDCGPDEETPTTVTHEEIQVAVTTIAPEVPPEVPSQETPVNAPETAEVAAAVPEEVATLRRNDMPILPDMHPSVPPMHPSVPPMYPAAGKSLYAPGYQQMPYLAAMSMDPYLSYRKMGVPPPLFPRSFYGYYPNYPVEK